LSGSYRGAIRSNISAISRSCCGNVGATARR